MSDHVIDIEHLSRSFGKTQALQDVSLRVPRGGVYGLIGSNGAGKTTLIKHILGSHYAQSGSVSVFGLDPVTDPVGVLGRIGYMSEDRDIPAWMRVQEIIGFTRSFYPAWDTGYAAELLELFELDPKQKIRYLSRGQAARVCLLLALSHRPELLVLDEPSSGLDPVIRRDILTAIVKTTSDDGRTVLFLRICSMKSKDWPIVSRFFIKGVFFWINRLRPSLSHSIESRFISRTLNWRPLVSKVQSNPKAMAAIGRMFTAEKKSN